MEVFAADVVIIGGGPAGSTAAALLKKYRPNARIVVVERSVFPRHHVGESTLPDTNPVLQKIGALAKLDAAGFVRKGGITYKWRHDRPLFSEDFARGVVDAGIPDHAWQVDRSVYDQILLENAAALGAEVWQPASVTRVLTESDRVTGVVVERRDGVRVRVDAKHVVDCSGQSRIVGRALGLETVEHRLGDLAVYRYYEGDIWIAPHTGKPELSKIFFAATPAGWIWYIPIGARLVSVGLVTRSDFARGRDLDALFDEQLATVPEMSAAIGRASVCPAPAADGPETTYTVQNWSYSHERVAGPGWYMAGDAAAFVDPILSSGLMLAHRAGLCVANAINTEWTEPDVDLRALHGAYSGFYQDLCAGFLRMAHWWYDQRGTEIEDWWKQAATLSREVLGDRVVDDVAAFMTFAAGYLSDFRFRHIGPAFGAEGLAICIEGLTGQRGAHRSLDGQFDVSSRAVSLRYESVAVESYLGTYLETNRWWKLPLLRFTRREGSPVEYRAPVQWGDDGVPDQRFTLAVVSELLALSEGQRPMQDVLADLHLRLDPGGQRTSEITRMAYRILGDLVGVGVISVSPTEGAMGKRSPLITDRHAPLVRRTSGVRLRSIGGAEERPPIVVFVFATNDGEVGYRPPTMVRDTVFSADEASMTVRRMLAACDGKHGADAAVGAAVDSAQPERRVLIRDFANVVLRELVGLGVVARADA